MHYYLHLNYSCFRKESERPNSMLICPKDKYAQEPYKYNYYKILLSYLYKVLQMQCLIIIFLFNLISFFNEAKVSFILLLLFCFNSVQTAF